MPSYSCDPDCEDCDLEDRIAELEEELQSLKKGLSLSESAIIPDRIRDILESVSEAVFIGFKKKIVETVNIGILTAANKNYLDGYLNALRQSDSIPLIFYEELKEYIAYNFVSKENLLSEDE